MTVSYVHNIKPLGFNWEMYDPFIFCAHHKDHYPKGNGKYGPDALLLKGRNIGSDFTVKDGFRMYHGDVVPGFPVHPHRGFETVTITLKGLVDHADSLGAAGRYGDGDVQWMTAGKGLQHAEMFPLIREDRENPLELLQIWINLPKKDKFAEPFYKMLWHEDLPVVVQPDVNGRKTTIRIIAGDFKQTSALSPAPDSWAANPENNVAIWIISMEPGGMFEIPSVNPETNRTLYNYQGEGIHIEGNEIPANHQAQLTASQKLKVTNSGSDTTFLLVQGKPIAEPVAQYGPFVMNTRAEIQQAYQDYTTTRFGGWPWERNDPVHGSKSARFARYIDGKAEER